MHFASLFDSINVKSVCAKARGAFGALAFSALMFSLLSLPSYASTEANQAEISARFVNLGIKVTEVAPSPIDGLYEVTTNQGIFFSSATGDFFIQGKMYSLDKQGNFSDLMAKKYAKQVEKFADDMIVYKAKEQKYVVTVFTDITCGYCVKLHKEIQKYNDLGITVRYMAYPRQGPTGDVAQAMAKVWCADDRKKALDDVKINRRFDFDSKNLPKCQQMISEQYAFGAQLGISGTPAILLSNGRIVGGYLPANDLLEALEAENL
ncbi:MAG TPA: bifunctional protein-disulfide isomerase/oxidoreductase DsbC [Vibrio sp.]|uniref:bifunctional protein-disulfide isomerase/oxidoreductase DsbC n=1 Tax=Vibrio TaxID=662 RepID=UPI000EDCACD9|nr:bifunctional protein-disulfide isomerase/oxidoreductase DsbC [Vibrio sp.]HCH03168.1 bifunctional protein-disulfide isomerase/oxidoreductase DsbC [Vibrio sp.]